MVPMKILSLLAFVTHIYVIIGEDNTERSLRGQIMAECDIIHKQRSLESLLCRLKVTKQQINEKIIHHEETLMKDQSGEKYLTWAAALQKVEEWLTGLISQSKRERRSLIETCFHLMAHLNKVNKILENGSKTKTYSVSIIESLITEVIEALDKIVCNDEGQKFVSHQMEILDKEILRLEEFLTTRNSTTLHYSTTKQMTIDLTSKHRTSTEAAAAKTTTATTTSTKTKTTKIMNNATNPTKSTTQIFTTSKPISFAKINTTKPTSTTELHYSVEDSTSFELESISFWLGMFLLFTITTAAVDICCVIFCLLHKIKI